MERFSLTFVPLLLDFELLGEIFVVLPLDLRPNSMVVHEIARVSHFLLIEISLLQNLILKVLVRSKRERKLEPGL